ncbi:sensor histidine kinase [Zavarzinella formosa]|uniref:sensor histidine kinase n=1 Tax=Zavarzinella formosa TaxID=360055 RepID=UPI0002DEA25E|nr:ATP-binding protein [Zavarzinella formosa]
MIKTIEAMEQRALELARSVEEARRQALAETDDSIETLELKARELARFVETTREKTLLQSDQTIEALEQKARDLADFVESLRCQASLQSDSEIALLGRQARDLAISVEAVRMDARLRAETEIALLGRQARDLAISVEAVRVMTLLKSNTLIAALRESEKVTARLNDELERRVLERTTQLEAANRELEAFAYSVSHDLRAPLRALDGFSDELLRGYGEQFDDKGRHYLQRVRAGTRRMGELIDDLLRLSRLSRGNIRSERVDLSGLAQAVAAELRQSEPDRRVFIDIGPDLAGEGDPGLLKVVLANLMGNAWKFTGKKPEATIVFGRTEQKGLPAFFVRDDGAGFDMRHASKLFGAFQRLHPQRDFPGNGIGLATVQRIIRRHGGQIWAESLPGGGATFYFTLPEKESA